VEDWQDQFSLSVENALRSRPQTRTTTSHPQSAKEAVRHPTIPFGPGSSGR